jgi:ABC-type Zn uptake system ZnuABC Zn-binding protein ZnuA
MTAHDEIRTLLYTYAERMDAGDLEGVARLFEYATYRFQAATEYQGSAAVLEALQRFAGGAWGAPWLPPTRRISGCLPDMRMTSSWSESDLLLLDFVARRQDFYRGALSHGCFCSTYSLRSTAYSLRGRPIWLRPAGRAMGGGRSGSLLRFVMMDPCKRTTAGGTCKALRVEMAGLCRRRFLGVLGPAALALWLLPAAAAERPLRVVVTVTDLGDLAKAVGGDPVDVFVMLKGAQDAHFVEARPSFIKELSTADLLIFNGLELEEGYLPLLLRNARNSRVLPGNPGYLDASRAITPLQVPTVVLDRSMGDVHPLGNPHYLLDPLNGIKVARLIRDRLAQLRPADRAYFDERYAAFKEKVDTALVGPELARKYDAEKLALLYEHGRLESFLRSQSDAQLLAGWLGRLAPHYGVKAVDDHNLWPYFARRFGIDVVGHMEPKPGIPPTTRHLSQLIEEIRAQGVKLILAAPYYDPRHARFRAEATGLPVVELAQQVDARPATADYIAMVDHNVNAVAAALAATPGQR